MIPVMASSGFENLCTGSKGRKDRRSTFYYTADDWQTECRLKLHVLQLPLIISFLSIWWRWTLLVANATVFLHPMYFQYCLAISVVTRFNMNRFSKLYRVMVQASPEYPWIRKRWIICLYGTMKVRWVQWGNIWNLRVYGAETLSRFNLFSAISVNGTPADGYSTGQAIRRCVKWLRNASGRLRLWIWRYVAWRGFNRQFHDYYLCHLHIHTWSCIVLFIYPVFVPTAVILLFRLGLPEASFAKMFGLENNIYLQIGLLMLIGLLAKTAILLTEYASERRRQGMSISSSGICCCLSSILRPILMTSHYDFWSSTDVLLRVWEW